ncbi:MAG: hypothetical protein VX589_02095 [Myxococcota bacterium]|nr:hypothetical protein [Myxococcota bacterium]
MRYNHAQVMAEVVMTVDATIGYYADYIPDDLRARLWANAQPIDGVPGLRVGEDLPVRFPQVETTEALTVVVDIFEEVKEQLADVLERRQTDRYFLDEVTAACQPLNANRAYTDPDYATAIGAMDDGGRVVLGPVDAQEMPPKPVTIPPYLQGEQVTLFGPPDTAKMCINAMNTLHRRLPNEDPIVDALVQRSGQVPRWGADNEDSKTPIMANLLAATQNLMGCFDGTLRFEEPARQRVYELAKDGLSKPIKRIAGLALPDGNHLFNAAPMPLHLVDFVLHAFHNWSRPEALVFYVPKLENEDEAAYFCALIRATERRIQRHHPDYVSGTIKVFLVFENPRAIFRIRAMADALHPHFVGGSLGWHDFLGSTARLFKNDPNYRIPVKADPNIVINHIRESHQILADALSPMGAIKIGGMYGVLFEDGNPESFAVSMIGYIKDVVTQLKRNLDGFWVAHPSFVRIGIALVEAWRTFEQTGDRAEVKQLMSALVTDPRDQAPLEAFVFGDDVAGLDRNDPMYARGVLAADLQTSDVIANHDPEEVRYNIFQALQYLADWLGGNGCVALPATLPGRDGAPVFVRIMDDLATTERSRWELWAEIHHGRVSHALFDRILDDEIDFIRADRVTPTKRVQVKWTGDAHRWYPIAVKILRALVLSPKPVEFATELLMPFTFDIVRQAPDPWAYVVKLAPERYSIR